MATFTAGRKLRASELETQVTRITELEADDAVGLGFYQRATTSSTSASSTLVGICRINTIPCVSGEPIRITYFGHPDSTTITDNIRTVITVSTSGSATTSSTVIGQSETFGPASASHRCVTFIYVPSVTGNHSFALCFSRPTGVGTADFFCDSNRKTQLSAQRWSGTSYAGGEDM